MYNKKVLIDSLKNLNKVKAPVKKKDVIVDPMGQWNHPGEVTRIPGENITMSPDPRTGEPLKQPLLGIDNNGNQQMMYPGKEYTFPGAEYVDEYPMAKKGMSMSASNPPYWWILKYAPHLLKTLNNPYLKNIAPTLLNAGINTAAFIAPNTMRQMAKDAFKMSSGNSRYDLDRFIEDMKVPGGLRDISAFKGYSGDDVGAYRRGRNFDRNLVDLYFDPTANKMFTKAQWIAELEGRDALKKYTDTHGPLDAYLLDSVKPHGQPLDYYSIIDQFESLKDPSYEKIRRAFDADRYQMLFNAANAKDISEFSSLIHTLPDNETKKILANIDPNARIQLGQDFLNKIHNKYGDVIPIDMLQDHPGKNFGNVNYSLDNNPVGPLDDIAGHMTFLRRKSPTEFDFTTRDVWGFHPKDYYDRWLSKDVGLGDVNAIRDFQRKAGLKLVNKFGKPFILTQTNPIDFNLNNSDLFIPTGSFPKISFPPNSNYQGGGSISSLIKYVPNFFRRISLPNPFARPKPNVLNTTPSEGTTGVIPSDIRLVEPSSLVSTDHTDFENLMKESYIRAEEQDKINQGLGIYKPSSTYDARVSKVYFDPVQNKMVTKENFENQYKATSNLSPLAKSKGNIPLSQVYGLLGKESMGDQKTKILKSAIEREYGTDVNALPFSEIQRITNNAIVPLEQKLNQGNSMYGLDREPMNNMSWGIPKKDLSFRLPTYDQYTYYLNTTKLGREKPEIIGDVIKEEDIISDKTYEDINTAFPNVGLNEPYSSGGLDDIEMVKFTNNDYLKNLTSQYGPGYDWKTYAIKNFLDEVQSKTRLGHNWKFPLESNTLRLSNWAHLGKDPKFHGDYFLGRTKRVAHDMDIDTLMHMHYYVDPQSPDTATMHQLQSDPFQGKHHWWKDTENQIKKLEDEIYLLENDFNAYQNKYGELNSSSAGLVDWKKKELKSLTEGLDAWRADIPQLEQLEMLEKNWEPIALQNFVKYAADRGFTKVRIPTGETAGKVQNYNKTSYEGQLRNEYIWDDPMNPDKKGDFVSDYKFSDKAIMRRYEQMPKTIKKAFSIPKNDIRKITDDKGNEFWEFEIPESFLKGEGQIIHKDGGPVVKQRRGTRKNPDGSESTHLMRAEYIPERGWVGFPSLFQNSIPYADDSQNWVDMSEEEDWMKIYEEAERRGEVYDFGEDKEAALAFGEGSWKDEAIQSPEAWEQEIRRVERAIGDPRGWTMDDYNTMQDKLNEYKAWRQRHPEVIDYSNKPNEYVVPLPPHLNADQYIETELSNEEIQKYVDGGYIVEELPKAQLGNQVSKFLQGIGKLKLPWTSAVTPTINNLNNLNNQLGVINDNSKFINDGLLDSHLINPSSTVLSPMRTAESVSHKMAAKKRDLDLSAFSPRNYKQNADNPISAALYPAIGPAVYKSAELYNMIMPPGYRTQERNAIIGHMTERLGNQYYNQMLDPNKPLNLWDNNTTYYLGKKYGVDWNQAMDGWIERHNQSIINRNQRSREVLKNDLQKKWATENNLKISYDNGKLQVYDSEDYMVFPPAEKSLEWNKIVDEKYPLIDQYPTLTKSGIYTDAISRPLTMFLRDETTPGNHLYRKIGNKSGLKDLIDKGGAQAPGPLKMRSGITIDTPFFGIDSNPSRDYKGMFAVETALPSKSKYNWSSDVAGTSNYGVAPFDDKGLVKNVPLDDLNVYRRKWFSNKYKKLDKEKLEKELKTADAQWWAENLWKWGYRGAAADYYLNDGKFTKGLLGLDEKAIGGPIPGDPPVVEDPMPITPDSELDKAQKFIRNWYNNRTLAPIDDPRYTKVMTQSLEDARERVKSFPQYTPLITDDPTARGTYIGGEKPEIQVVPNLDPEEDTLTKVHELTTYVNEPLTENPQYQDIYSNIIKQNVKSFKEGWGDLKGADKKAAKQFYDYVTDPSEDNIHSYMMNARRIFDVSPDQVVTEADIENWKKTAEDEGMLDRNSENYNDELYILFKLARDNKSMTNMFNYLAMDESPQMEGDIQMAKMGGVISLGDEVDEATMKKLKAQGYTFEEI